MDGSLLYDFLPCFVFCPPDGAWRKEPSFACPPKSAFTRAAILRPSEKVLGRERPPPRPRRNRPSSFFVPKRKGKNVDRDPSSALNGLFTQLQKHCFSITWSRLCLRSGLIWLNIWWVHLGSAAIRILSWLKQLFLSSVSRVFIVSSSFVSRLDEVAWCE